LVNFKMTFHNYRFCESGSNPSICRSFKRHVGRFRPVLRRKTRLSITRHKPQRAAHNSAKRIWHVAPETDQPMPDTIVVFTEVTQDSILAAGGSGDWVLNPQRASQAKYLLCCRKTRWNNMDDPTPNGAAFLVGRIKRLRPGIELAPSAKHKRGQRRYFIEISEYAAISKDNVWKEWRNPVRYDSLDKLGISPRSLKFSQLPVAAQSSRNREVSQSPPRTLTIAEAKKALAASFGVSPDDIEIHIRG
jgi:hypothetical protein